MRRSRQFRVAYRCDAPASSPVILRLAMGHSWLGVVEIERVNKWLAVMRAQRLESGWLDGFEIQTVLFKRARRTRRPRQTAWSTELALQTAKVRDDHWPLPAESAVNYFEIFSRTSILKRVFFGARDLPQYAGINNLAFGTYSHLLNLSKRVDCFVTTEKNWSRDIRSRRPSWVTTKWVKTSVRYLLA